MHGDFTSTISAPQTTLSAITAPRNDWLESDSLKLAHLTDSVTLYIPKDGTVGIVMNGFK